MPHLWFSRPPHGTVDVDAAASTPPTALLDGDASCPPPFLSAPPSNGRHDSARHLCLRESELADVASDLNGVFAPPWMTHHAHQRAGVEPLSEPCGEDEIPLAELVYWLGNAATGQVECTCGDCARQRGEGHGSDGYYVYIPTSIYERLRAKIPVIAVPRIEGIN